MATMSRRILSFVGVLCLLQSKVAAETPTIYVSGVFELGKTKELTCAVITNDGNDADNTLLTMSMNGTSYITNKTSRDNTTYPQVTLSNYYDYTVRALDNEEQLECCYDGDCVYWTVYVYKRVDQLILSGPTSVLGGENGTWACEADGAVGYNPSFKWKFGNNTDVKGGLISNVETEYVDSTNSLTTRNITSSLTLTVTVGAPTFLLKCQVVQSKETISANITVTVAYAPQVSTSASDLSVTNGSSATLQCSVSAEPAVTSVTWYKNGVALNTTDNRFSGATPSQPSLSISPVLKEDAGVYVCGATNTVGSGNSTDISLVVKYIPIITATETIAGGSLGSDVTVTCNIDSQPDYTSVNWYRISSTTGAQTSISSTSNSSKYSGGTASTTPDLTIKNFNNNDEGLYQCTAVNSEGTGQGPIITVQAYYAPKITIDESKTSVENQTVTLNCTVDAFPDVTSVKWYEGEEAMDISGNSRYTGGTASSPSLTINGVRPADAGTYYCEATNVQGNASSNDTILTVYYKPRAGSINNVTANTGQTVTLSCSTDSNPAATNFTWKKEGVTVGSGSQLTVTVNSTSNFGRYDCLASNQYGTSDPIGVYIKQVDDGGGVTGQSTEDTGLSTATLILIIIICIIVLIVVILLIIVCCASERCKSCFTKDNDVSPSVVAQPAITEDPVANKPLAAPASTKPNGHAPGRAAHTKGRQNGRMDMDDDRTIPPLTPYGTAALGNGLTISVPGSNNTPRPHHLPPLGQDGVPEETMSARDDKPKKKKRRRRHRYNDDANADDLKV